MWGYKHLYMHPANEKRRCIVTSSLIGWAHMHKDHWKSGKLKESTHNISVSVAPAHIGTPDNKDHRHDDVIIWKHFPRYWLFVRGIHRSPVNSPHKGQWRGTLMFSLICARINDWVNNREAGDLRRHRDHCDVIVMGSTSIQRAPISNWRQSEGLCYLGSCDTGNTGILAKWWQNAGHLVRTQWCHGIVESCEGLKSETKRPSWWPFHLRIFDDNFVDSSVANF